MRMRPDSPPLCVNDLTWRLFERVSKEGDEADNATLRNEDEWNKERWDKTRQLSEWNDVRRLVVRCWSNWSDWLCSEFRVFDDDAFHAVSWVSWVRTHVCILENRCVNERYESPMHKFGRKKINKKGQKRGEGPWFEKRSWTAGVRHAYALLEQASF